MVLRLFLLTLLTIAVPFGLPLPLGDGLPALSLAGLAFSAEKKINVK